MRFLFFVFLLTLASCSGLQNNSKQKQTEVIYGYSCTCNYHYKSRMNIGDSDITIQGESLTDILKQCSKADPKIDKYFTSNCVPLVYKTTAKLKLEKKTKKR